MNKTKFNLAQNIFVAVVIVILIGMYSCSQSSADEARVLHVERQLPNVQDEGLGNGYSQQAEDRIEVPISLSNPDLTKEQREVAKKAVKECLNTYTKNFNSCINEYGVSL